MGPKRASKASASSTATKKPSRARKPTLKAAAATAITLKVIKAPKTPRTSKTAIKLVTPSSIRIRLKTPTTKSVITSVKVAPEVTIVTNNNEVSSDEAFNKMYSDDVDNKEEEANN